LTIPTAASCGVFILKENEVIFELVVFDSQDLDNLQKSDETWGDELSSN